MGSDVPPGTVTVRGVFMRRPKRGARVTKPRQMRHTSAARVGRPAAASRALHLTAFEMAYCETFDGVPRHAMTSDATTRLPWRRTTSTVTGQPTMGWRSAGERSS